MSIKFLCIVLMMGSLLQGEQYMFRISEEQRKLATEAQALVNADKIENGHQYFGDPIYNDGEHTPGHMLIGATYYPTK